MAGRLEKRREESEAVMGSVMAGEKKEMAAGTEKQRRSWGCLCWWLGGRETAALPYTVCEEIEKQTRAFLFGSGVKKPHLVRWDRA
ncbi:hypothetical protein OIU78_002865 [Salix suchowensis]|nr:hypothetical protein OIU78_002865 [Salix suchowensis]